VTAEQLGGPEAHMIHSGVIHFIAEDDRHAILLCQKLLSFLPANNLEDPPQIEGDCTVDPNPLLETLVPVDPKQAYDVLKVIAAVVDFGDFLEVQAGHAPNIVVGFGRIGGNSVGIVANQPSVQAGVLDIDASNKASRFIRFCNAFNIPVVTFVDVPGFLPGVKQEYGGIIRHGAKLLFAYASATVPKITVILRKSYGGAYLAMCGKDLGADRVFAWPTAEVAVMGAEGPPRSSSARRSTRPTSPKRSARSSSPSTARPSPTPTWRPSTGWWMRSSSPRSPAGTWPRRWNTCASSASRGPIKSTA
jgi:methylmalonyl-CoA carboxyltransferase large subunit